MSKQRSIPAEQLYWGIIDTSGFPPLAFAMLRPDAVKNRYANQFDALLPIAVEELHVVYHEIGTNSVLGCGIEHDRIHDLRETGLDLVHPASLPSDVYRDLDSNGINLSELDTQLLNFLTGNYLPVSVVASRNRRHRWRTAAVLLIAALVSIGNIRRERRHAVDVDDLRSQQAELYQAALGTEPSSLPPAVRLTTELRRLSATRGTGGEFTDSADAMLDLETIFRAWPEDARLRVERLSVSADRIDIAAEASATYDFERLIAAMKDLTGWDLKQRRIDQGQGEQPSRARLGFNRSATEGDQS